MAIKKYFIEKTAKPGYPYDRNAKKHFSYGYDIWVNGERKQERGFLNKKDAENAVSHLKEQAKYARLGIVTVGDTPFLLELFSKKLADMTDRKDRVRASRVFKYFCLLPDVPKQIRVTELKTAHLQIYIEARTKDGVSAQTIRRELVPIVAALKSGYKYFPELDDYRPPRVPRPRVIKSKKERVISIPEQNKLFKYFFAPPRPEEIRQEPKTRRRTGQFLLFCLLSLSRPGEIAALKKTDIDLHAGIVSITGRKSRFTATQIVRRMQISPTMRSILEERFELAKTEYLFTKSGYVTPDMYEELKAACEASGIKYGRIDRDAVSFHTARHTGITMLVQSGELDLKTVGKLAGHSDAQMTLYYTHAHPKLVMKAAEFLEQKMGREIGLSAAA